MPKLWSDTIEKHRHEVRGAIMETTWSLALEHGPLSVSMSQIALETGIGRATLYKYFPDVETILHASHERHVLGHLAQLEALGRRPADPMDRLETVALAYARICLGRGRHGSPELSVMLHKPGDIAGAEHQLLTMFEELVAEAATARQIRTDTSAAELAAFCVHALGAANGLETEASVGRLVSVILAALRPVTS